MVCGCVYLLYLYIYIYICVLMSLYIYIAGWGEARKCKGKKKKGRKEEKKDSGGRVRGWRGRGGRGRGAEEEGGANIHMCICVYVCPSTQTLRGVLLGDARTNGELNSLEPTSFLSPRRSGVKIDEVCPG